MSNTHNPKEELKALQVKSAAIIAGAKAAGREFSDSELVELESNNDRATLLAAAISQGEKGAAILEALGSTGAGETVYPNGIEGQEVKSGTADRRGFITPASLKATAQRAAVAGIKAITAGGASIVPVEFDSKPVPLGQAGLGLLSALPVRTRATRAYSFIKQQVRTNNAAVVPAGEEKPVSVYTVAAVTGELKVYAHLSEPLDTMLLRDVPDLASFEEAELRNGLVRRLNVDFAAQLAAASGAQAQAFTGSAAVSLYAGISRVTSAGYSVSALVVSTADYDAIRLSKEEGTGRYLGGSPFDGGEKAPLWGVTTVLVPSTDLPAGKAVVLGEDAAGISTDAEGITTKWDPYTGFSNNTVRALTEGRFALDIQRPEAICVVSLTE